MSRATTAEEIGIALRVRHVGNAQLMQVGVAVDVGEDFLSSGLVHLVISGL